MEIQGTLLTVSAAHGQNRVEIKKQRVFEREDVGQILLGLHPPKGQAILYSCRCPSAACAQTTHSDHHLS